MSLRPLSGYIGGKWYLRGTLCPLIDAIPHDCYVEPFLGMGNIFLGRERRPRVEVINDVFDEVVNLFRVVQRHPDELCRQLSTMLTSRSEYGRLRRVDASTLTDVEQAARFVYLRRMTYAGKDDYEAGFGWSRSSAKVFTPDELAQRIEAIHARLDRVVIENLDFRTCIERYDAPGTFFYLDPPYWGHGALYRDRGLKEADFVDLAGLLRVAKGRWMVSLNDHPSVRELFAWAAIEEVETRYNASVARGSSRVHELLIQPAGNAAG